MWSEEYRCGCVSEIVASKRDLLGYCKHHGEDRRRVFKHAGDVVVQHEKATKPSKEGVK